MRADAATPPFSIRLFGPFEVSVTGQPLPRLRFRKSQALLALLALRQGAAVERDWLLGLLWPEGRGTQALRNALTSLRQTLGPEASRLLSPTPRTLALDLTGAFVDVLAFDAALARRDPDALAEAVAFYRGPLLEGWSEEWVFQERQVREQQYLAARERLAALASEASELAVAEQHLRPAIAADPLRESAQRALMQVLAAQGNYAAALLCYRELRERLHREANAEPDPETQALFQRLREEARDKLGLASHRPALRPNDCEPMSATPVPRDEALPSPAVSHNVPRRFTCFFGRDAEIAGVIEMLGGGSDPSTLAVPPLVTLTGPGGTGKTRLALQVAERLRNTFPAGAWFVSLQEIIDPRLIPDQVLLSLQCPRAPDQAAFEQAATLLSRAPALLVLDNFEHLVESGAETVQRLREQAEHLTLLVTSRRRLGLEGEREFSVGPLPVSEPGAGERWTDCEALCGIPSVALFVDRAQAVRPDFQVTARNAGAVAALCRQLEGLPLAIELAAARAGVLTPEQMLTRLSERESARWALLVSRQHLVNPRHHSLRATLDWSYQLLSPELQRFFARLSVFRGGWSLEAAQAVCEAGEAICYEPKALSYLQELREYSMMQVMETAGKMRFHLLETLREYGWEQLNEEDRSALARQHMLFFLDLAETAEPELTGADQELWLDRLEREHDNLRAALDWSVETREPELGLRLGAALQDFWYDRCYYREGRDSLLRLLAQPGAEAATPVRARALIAVANSSWFQDLDRARALSGESVEIWRALGDPLGIASSLEHLAHVCLYQGDLPAARAASDERLAIHRNLGDAKGVASSLCGLGWVALPQGQIAAARDLLEESLAISRELDDHRQVISALGSLGYMTTPLGDLDRADSLLKEELAAAKELDYKAHIAYALSHLGELACARDEFDAALPLFEQSMAIWEGIDDPSGVIATLRSWGWAARYKGEHTAAYSLFTKALAASRKWGSSRGIVRSLVALGEANGDRGDWQQATALFAESLPFFGPGDRGDVLLIPRCLHGLARSASARGQPARAARLMGTAAALDTASGIVLWPAQRRESEEAVAAVRAQLTAADFETAWAVGRAMPLDGAMALALREVSAG